MPRKTNSPAFENSTSPELLLALRRLCDEQGFDAAAVWAKDNIPAKPGRSAIHRWYHKDDDETLLRSLADSALLTRQVNDAGMDVDATLQACERALSAIALKVASSANHRDDADAIESATRMFKVVADSYRTRQTLSLEKDKFAKTLQTKLEAGLDALLAEVKGNVKGEALIRELNTVINQEARA